MAGLVSFIVTVLIFVISSLPLYFAVRLLGGKTTLIKTVLVSFISGIIVSAIRLRFETFGAIIAFGILIWIYHEMFRLRWMKALLAWLLQFVFIALFYFLAALFFALIIGISVLALL
jgi:hypothetical protein